jgi:hypothetical protein
MFDLVKHDAGMVSERTAGRREDDAPPAAFKQCRAG